MRVGLTFDDVLLVPKRTRVTSRREVDLSTQLLSGLVLRLPILSANTPWCTEARMAASIALLGGLGFIHRMQTPERQAGQVQEAKSTAIPPELRPEASLDPRGRVMIGAAVGVRGDYLRRAELLIESEADILLVDVAHGHSDQVLRAVDLFKRSFPGTPLVAGNVATSEGTADLIEAGADIVKVGIGPGGTCTTRLVAGCGVPQLTAIFDCCEAASAHNVPIIADGGIRTSGDITKAVAAGASAVMLGTLLAGANESAAPLGKVDGRPVRQTTGFATFGMQLTLKQAEGFEVTPDELTEYVSEGVELSFPCTGPLRNTILQLAGGLRSGLSYCGAMNIRELQAKAEFIGVSPAGLVENAPHAAGHAPPPRFDALVQRAPARAGAAVS